MITVTPVRDRSERRLFVDFPYVFYRDDSHWVPPPRIMERARFKSAHPFFQHAEMQLFLAKNDGRVVGRIAAIDDHLHHRTHRDNAAAFGFFEAASEIAAHHLLVASEEWARARGRASLRGPLNPSLNETAGLLIDAFDDDPMVMMPYNPRAYAAYLETAGYCKAKDLFAWMIDLGGEGLAASTRERCARVGDRVHTRHGLTIRSVDMTAFDAEIQRFVDVYCSAWRDNWGFVAPTSAEVHQMATELRHLVDHDLVIAAEVGGHLVGCAIALPDLNQAFKGTGGRLLPVAVRLLTRKRIVTQLRVVLFGVIPEYRGTGLAAPLILELLTRASRTYQRVELSWVLEDNELTNSSLAWLGGRVYKTYRIYEKKLR